MRSMLHSWGIATGLSVAMLLSAPQQARSDSDEEIVARINSLIEQGYRDNDVTASEQADDSEFARRSALDAAQPATPSSAHALRAPSIAALMIPPA